MKKLKFTAVFLTVLLSAVPVETNFVGILPNIIASDSEDDSYYEEPIEYGDMLFQKRENRENELMLVSYWGKEANLVIPEKVEGYTVTGIYHKIFATNKGKGFVVENVTLPDSIDYFEEGIFEKSTIVSVNIPKSLRLIPSNTFRNCSNLKKVTFHDDIIAVASNAFANTDITLPQNIQDMIANDNGETKMNSEYHFNSRNDDFTFGFDTDKNTGSLYCSIDGYTGKNTEIVLPENISRVPLKSVNFAESDLSEITSVVFPETDNMISVAKKSFSNSPITELYIKSPCIIETESFENCKNLKSVTFKGDAEIKSYAFKDCTSLTSVEFDDKVNLNYYAFMDCTALENITLDTSQEIPGNAFNGCTSLLNINSKPVFDSTSGDLSPEYSDFIRNNFYMAEDIGFLNEFTKAQYQKIAREVTAPGMSDIEKVKALHDWICKNTRYADDIAPEQYHTDASILLNSSTVCEGYAKALNLLLNAVGIETCYVQSEDHAWNVVKIGGHCFHIDTTWDDGDTVSYSFFMKSDSEIKDGGSHSSWKVYAPTSLHAFQTKVTPECKYQVGDVNKDGGISVADAVRMTNYLLGAEKETADNIVLYDLDFNGKADVFDMIVMRRKIVEK